MMKMFIGFTLVFLLIGCLGGAVGAESWHEPTTGIEFVEVAGGCFQMGQDESEMDKLALLMGAEGAGLVFGDELPAHEVCFSGFGMSKYEITVAEFAKFVKATGYRTEAEQGGGCQEYLIPRYIWQENPARNWRSPGFAQKNNEPVVCVSWNDATAFADWLSKIDSGKKFRLPTEAEWEFAARDGGQAKTSVIDGGLDRLGWYVENSPRRTSPVGGKQAGQLGIFDLHGNVWEWVGDYYDRQYYSLSPRENPTGPEQGRFRTIRGGGWNSFVWNCRSAKRDRALASHRDTNLGFRLVYSERK